MIEEKRHAEKILSSEKLLFHCHPILKNSADYEYALSLLNNVLILKENHLTPSIEDHDFDAGAA